MSDFIQKMPGRTQAAATSGQGDLRNDGTRKDVGFLGKLKLPDGSHATEFSIGVPIMGKETEIPTLVPTLTKEEIELMRTDIIPNRKKIPEPILRKAVEHANERVRRGLSPFYSSSEGSR